MRNLSKALFYLPDNVFVQEFWNYTRTLLANTVNTKNIENFTEFTTALPTQLLDINGELITQFSSDEKRELITIDQLPHHMLDALLTREDRTFFRHRGFSAKALARAVVGKLTGKDLAAALPFRNKLQEPFTAIVQNIQ